jgi:Ca2+/Na+ antiporter
VINPKVFFRDVIFYIGALVILVIASIHGYINFIFAGFFIGWYAFFIIIVVIIDVQERKKRKKEKRSVDSEDKERLLLED